MGFRFQRSMKLLPGVRLNFSKSGVGVSFGVRGARYSMSPNGRRSVSAGIPGTGLSWRESASGGSGGGDSSPFDASYAKRTAKPKGPGCGSVGSLIVGVMLLLAALSARPVNFDLLALSALFLVPAAFVFGISAATKKAQRPIEDDRAHEGAGSESSSSDIPETLAEIVAEQSIYEPLWESYQRAKAGNGGGIAAGLPLDPDEVAFYAVSGELFDPAKGLDSIQGTVLVTNKRVIFDSVSRNHEWVLAKLVKYTVTGPGQRVFAVKGRTRNLGLLFADHVNDFDNALGLALHLSNPRFTPESPEPVFEDYLKRLATRRAELERSTEA